MSAEVRFVSATPVLASLDIERSVAFYVARLGFTRVHVEQGVYGMVESGQVELHFWACDDRRIAEATSCRIRVRGIEALYGPCREQGIVHPNAALDRKPWGTREFAILDPDGNLVTFWERPVA